MESNGAQPTLRVLFFSVLRERTGQREIELAWDRPITGDELFERLSGRWPAMRPYREIVRLAVNQAYVSMETVLQSGDEVVFITPVSGG